MASILEGIGFEPPKKGELEFECYDISHTDGHFTVASRVVTTNGKANPNKYRKYKIKSLADGMIDDFASMREVMYRRVLEGFESNNFPTMFLIDGGKGQLSSAREGIERAVAEWESRRDVTVRTESADLAPNGVKVAAVPPTPSEPVNAEKPTAGGTDPFPNRPADCLPEPANADPAQQPVETGTPPLPFLASLAKREEEIFTEENEESVKFAKGSPELAVIVNLRDEAHRFAITFNRKTRSKAMKKNVLEELPGFGPATRKKLLTAAGSVEGIRELDRSELEKILNKTQIETLESHAII